MTMFFYVLTISNHPALSVPLYINNYNNVKPFEIETLL